MNVLQIKELFKRYLAHKGTAADNNAIDKWYDQLDQETPVVLDEKKEQILKEEIWLSIIPELKPGNAVVKKLNYQWIKIAASVIFISSAALLFWKSSAPKKAQPAITYSSISTKIGERKQINLPDGSVITLNSASNIQIADNFQSKRSVIITDGEAFFDVKHDEKHPFIIQSGTLTTQVLGTSFNIRAYSKLNKLSIGVTSGKVGIMFKKATTQYLTTDQQLVFDQKLVRFVVTKLDKQSLAWQQGNMVLNDASFSEMALLMYKNYDLRISTQDKTIQDNHFTTVLSTSMPALKALEVITAIHHLKTKQRRDTIEIFR
ncbi:FecR family protein [Mucilaginibacter aquaedulcis]|uniref:FecR family protein n=1 Tax=Mucilaginibacter aquaedulcis TaxID=1187081 RepID=UPI0025B4E655|nr:FecR domain-containing protein [Mucilaginibacter aquaedulcis]MDN3550003.1 FecR domain-containing protein [Mucilaginibacter aquaedulcis]